MTGRARTWLALVFSGALVSPAVAVAQEAPPRVTVQVRQVAGTSVYLEVGTNHGLATGDTLTAYRSEADGGGVAGRLVVTASTDQRSVLTFVGDPFPVTRGASLTLQLLRAPAEAPPEPPPPSPRPSPPPEPAVPPPAARPAPSEAPASRPAPERPREHAHGRIGFDLSAVRSTTKIGEVDPVNVGRTFATPAMRLDLTVPDAVGPLRLRTSMRMAYRYSSEDIVQPATSTRVYAASLEGDFERFRVALGRFHSPVEPYSGFWDGAMLRVGGRGLGVGAIAGFEPNRWNEKPSTDVPKVTAFVDARSRGQGWRWSGDLSAHAVRPKDGTPDHNFVGASQRLYAGPLRLSHDLAVDRDPSGGSWRISRLRVRASLDLTDGVQLRGGVARREPWIPGVLLESPFGSRRDRADLGLAFRGEAGFLSLDASRSKDAGGHTTWGGTGTFMVRRLPGAPGMGAWGSVARWSGPYGSTFSAAPALTFDLAPAWLRVGYRFNRSDYLSRVSLTHALEGSVDVPFASGLRASGRLRLQFGGFMTSQSFNVTLYRIF